MTGLRRSNCSAPGIERRRRGRGFTDRWPTGRTVTEPDVLDRIRNLGIPPAWVDGATSPTARRRAMVEAVKEVARYLGNTPAVSRSSDSDPRVIDRFEAGESVRVRPAPMTAKGGRSPSFDHPARVAVEKRVIALLSGNRRRRR